MISAHFFRMNWSNKNIGSNKEAPYHSHSGIACVPCSMNVDCCRCVRCHGQYVLIKIVAYSIWLCRNKKFSMKRRSSIHSRQLPLNVRIHVGRKWSWSLVKQNEIVVYLKLLLLLLLHTAAGFHTRIFHHNFRIKLPVLTSATKPNSMLDWVIARNVHSFSLKSFLKTKSKTSRTFCSPMFAQSFWVSHDVIAMTHVSKFQLYSNYFKFQQSQRASRSVVALNTFALA